MYLFFFETKKKKEYQPITVCCYCGFAIFENLHYVLMQDHPKHVLLFHSTVTNSVTRLAGKNSPKRNCRYRRSSEFRFKNCINKQCTILSLACTQTEFKPLANQCLEDAIQFGYSHNHCWNFCTWSCTKFKWRYFVWKFIWFCCSASLLVDENMILFKTN